MKKLKVKFMLLVGFCTDLCLAAYGGDRETWHDGELFACFFCIPFHPHFE